MVLTILPLFNIWQNEFVKKFYLFWLGSFAIIATSLLIFTRVTVLPIIAGGVLALIFTFFLNKKK